MPASAISNIPIEIYGEIFLHYVDLDHNNFWAPLILTAVCTSWRNAALRLPRLWANLALRGDKYGDKFMDLEDPFYRMVYESKDPGQKAGALRRGLSRGEDVQEWLNRSGGCSLSVEYCHSGPTNTRRRSLRWGGVRDATVEASFYAAFSTARERVVKLTLTGLTNGSQTEAVETFRLTTFPKLETLIVQERSQLKAYLQNVTLPNIRFLQATVGAGEWNNDFEMTDISSNLPGLTSCNLKLTAVSSADLIKFFNNPHLKEVTLNLPTWEHQDDTPLGKSNSQVTTLHMKGTVGRSTKLAELYLPKLRVFSWSDAYEMKPCTVRSQLKKLVEKSAPPLDTLSFYHIQIKEKALKETVTATPSLRVLKLHATRISDDFIQLLDPEKGLCPSLEVLDVNVKKSPHSYPRITRSALESLKSSRDQSLTIIYNDECI